KKLAKVLEKRGCNVLVAMWNPELGLKIDDVLVKHGPEMVKKIMADALPYAQWLKSIEKQINSITQSRDTSDLRKKSKLPSADAKARELAEDYRDRLAFNNEVLCWYRYETDTPGVWSPETDEYIESVVYQLLKSQGLEDIPPAYVTAVVKFLRHELIKRSWRELPNLLPFQNGALEIATSKLLPHSPGHNFTWSLPRQHSAVASDWSKIADWLHFVSKGNKHIQDLIIAFCNAVLKGRADIQKFLHLIGIGGSGKGTLMRLIIALIGVENTHSTTLDDWCSNRFEAAQAYKKRLVVFPDEDKGTRKLGKFKQLTGGDWLRAEEKGKKPFKFQFEGMVVLGSNFPIFGADNSSGMARRTITVPFDAVVGSVNLKLGETFEPELAAFTNYLLSLDDDWVERILRGVVDIPEINLQGWENTIRDNPIAGFLNDRLIYDPLAQTSIGDSAYAEGSIYQAYDLYCSEQGHKPQAIKNFSPNLIELASTILGWQVEKVHTRVGKIVKGLRLRTKADEYIPTYDYELHSRCDGFCDGSVTDSVTGQNSVTETIVTGVTDKPLIQGEKLIDDIPTTDKACEEVKTENIESAIDFYPSHPSLEPETLSIKEPDPSQNPSHYPSQNPSPTSLSVGVTHEELKVRDRVQILDDGEYHGSYGEVTDVGLGRAEKDYYIALDDLPTLKVVISVLYTQNVPVLKL
ncbi:phage/plasmid primase, P4 family, partial [Microcoleus sp. Pol12B4]